MNSSVRRVWLTLTATPLLLWLNLEGSQGDGWFNVPNPLIESHHLRNQSIENCAEKQFFTLLNVSIHPRAVSDCSQSVTAKGAWIPSEDILYLGCYASTELNGEVISSSTKDSNMCQGGDIECPMIKGKLYERQGVVYPLPCVVNKGEYKMKVYCKNQDDETILCVKATFVWV